MGQSWSIHHDSSNPLPHRSRRSVWSGLEGQPISLRRRRLSSTEDSLSTDIYAPFTEPEIRPLRPLATFSRQVSSQSIPADPGMLGADYDVSRRDDEFYEQHEQRPTTSTDLHIQNTPITHITASPMPRRSRLSRFNSWLVDRHVRDEAISEPVQFGQSVSIQAGFNEDPRRSSWRSSVFPTFYSPSISPRSRRIRENAPISSPLPLDTQPDPPRSTIGPIPTRTSLPSSNLSTNASVRGSGFFSNPFAARLSRLAHSVSNQLDIPSPATVYSGNRNAHNPPIRPSSPTSSDDPDFHLPPVNLSDTNTSLNEAVLGAANREPRPFQIPTLPEAFEAAELPADDQYQHETQNSGTPERPEERIIANILRRDFRDATQRRDTPWLHILNATANAIAAQISGNPEQSVINVQGLESQDQDGRLQRLSRNLRHAIHTRLYRNTNEVVEDAPSLNSLQIFRLISSSANARSLSEPFNAGGIPEESAASLSAEGRNSIDDHHGRSITFILVGVRSSALDQQAFDSEEQQALAMAPDTTSALGLSLLGSSTSLAPSRTVGMPRNVNRLSRNPHLRRASYGGAFRTHDVSYTNHDIQRHHHRSISSRPGSGDVTPSPETTTPFAFSESPPGPAPPPSTPAEHTLSAVSSQATTPSRRVSVVSSLQHPPVFDHEIPIQGSLQQNGGVSEDRPFQFVQQRRRSNSESARHRNLGLGAARRNGMVEPDDLDAGEASASGGRTWIFYIIGTNLPEDHPAWTTPSLFTDVSLLAISDLFSALADPYDLESLLRGHVDAVFSCRSGEATCRKPQRCCVRTWCVPYGAICELYGCQCTFWEWADRHSCWRAMPSMS